MQPKRFRVWGTQANRWAALASLCRHHLAHMRTPSPTLSPTDPVPRGLLTLCPAAAASSGPQGQ